MTAISAGSRWVPTAAKYLVMPLVACIYCTAASAQTANSSNQIGASSTSTTGTALVAPVVTPLPAAPAPENPYARFDAWSLKPSWNIPFPEVQDSITQDAGGVRSALADAGFGVDFVSVSRETVNFATIGTRMPSGQQYNGQQATFVTDNYLYLTADLQKTLGIPNAKLVYGMLFTGTNWKPLGPNYVGLNVAYYEQRFLNNHLDLQIGYLLNGTQYVGDFVGGSFEGGTLGPQAIITDEVGLADQTADAPGINLTVRGDGFYDKAGIQRSVAPGGTVSEITLDRNGYKFNVKGTKALLIDEVGYQVEASPTQYSVWLRGGGIYNFTKYSNFSNSRASENYGIYALADFQLSRNFADIPYSGIYVGGSFMYAPQKNNLYTQYYELRLYDFAPFHNRPADIATLVATDNLFSNEARSVYGSEGVSTYHASMSLTGSYTFHITHGLYLGGAFTYTRNPSFTRQPGDPNAYSGIINLVINM